MSLVPTKPRRFVPSDHAPDQETELTAHYYFDLVPRTLTVVEVADLSPTLRRVRFSADDGFADFPTASPEDHLKLFFDRTADGAPQLPQMQEGRWSPRGLTYRDYTVRWFDPEHRWLDVDFVLHEHGIAGRWAAQAQPGQQLGALGPRGAFLVKDVFPWYVMAVDETALPALARWLEMLRPQVPVTAYIQRGGPGSRMDLPTRASLQVHWLDGDDVGPGSSGGIAEAVRRHDFSDGAGGVDRSGFVWVAGEAMDIKPLRRFLRDELGLHRDHWDVDGYWRRGQVNHDHHQDDDEE